MNISNEEYRRETQRHTPRSPIGRHLLGAFLIGGLICCLGQFFLELYQHFGLEEQAAGTAECVTMVFLGAVLTGFGVYDDIASYAGAGTLVPITGFANSVAAPALEFKTEGLITGMAARMFGIAGPVLVFGLSSSVLYGLALVLFELA